MFYAADGKEAFSDNFSENRCFLADINRQYGCYYNAPVRWPPYTEEYICTFLTRFELLEELRQKS